MACEWSSAFSLDAIGGERAVALLADGFSVDIVVRVVAGEGLLRRTRMVTLLPRYVAEGKKYLTIALGCTGGRHRSVFVAEKLAAHLAETSSMHGWRVELAHRELPEIARGSNTPHAENGHPDLLPDIAPRDTHMTTVE